MTTATVESIACLIAERLDERLEKEANADRAADNFRHTANRLKEALSDGLEGLIEKGRHRGVYLCSLEVKDSSQAFSLHGITRRIQLPIFNLQLGDDQYRLAPTIDIEKGTVTYGVPNRQLFFVCNTLPPCQVELRVDSIPSREFTAHRALEFVGMLLTGKN